MERGVSWRELAGDGIWWRGVALAAGREVARACGVDPLAPLACMGPHERYGDLPCDALATYALATDYLENGYLEKVPGDDGTVLCRPSEAFLETCEGQWPLGPWPGIDGHGRAWVQDVAALLAATSCAHASADLGLADEQFQERMLSGAEGRREAWRWASDWAPALAEQVPAEGLAQRAWLPSAPGAAEVVGQATRSARTQEAASAMDQGTPHEDAGAQDCRRTRM